MSISRRESAKLNLQDGELIIRAGRTQVSEVFWFFGMGLVANGRLYLTDRRLVWNRSRFNVPFLGPRSFEVALSDVGDCRVHSWGFKVSARHWQSHWFSPGLFWMNPFYRKATERWADAIGKAVVNGREA